MEIADLFEIASKRKSMRSFYDLKKLINYWGKDVSETVENINSYIKTIINNNTAHGIVSSARWALQIFYGSKFIPDMIVSRAGEISKFTTRLELQEIIFIRKKFKDWIDEKILNLVINKREYIKHSRTRIYHCFECLLCSGMRIGELISIDYENNPAHRIIWSNLNKCYIAELIINTEKTCKKREIYLPYESYKFLVADKRKYGCKRRLLTKSLVTTGFIEFAKWAKLPFKFTAHVLRRTKASFMHEGNVDVNTIAMVLGNTPKVVMNHYILSSKTNFDACELGMAIADNKVEKISNVFLTRNYKVNPNNPSKRYEKRIVLIPKSTTK